MQTIIINGSHRKDGNTFFLCEKLKEEIKDAEIINLNEIKISPCKACSSCPEKCVQDDEMVEIYKKLESADAIILATPTYFANVSGLMKNFMDRTIFLRRHNKRLSNKICAGIVAGGNRNGGQEFTINAIHNWALIHNMIIANDGLPDPHFGVISVSHTREETSAKYDDIALKSIDNIAKRIKEIYSLTN